MIETTFPNKDMNRQKCFILWLRSKTNIFSTMKKFKRKFCEENSPQENE